MSNRMEKVTTTFSGSPDDERVPTSAGRASAGRAASANDTASPATARAPASTLAPGPFDRPAGTCAAPAPPRTQGPHRRRAARVLRGRSRNNNPPNLALPFRSFIPGALPSPTAGSSFAGPRSARRHTVRSVHLAAAGAFTSPRRIPAGPAAAATARRAWAKKQTRGRTASRPRAR